MLDPGTPATGARRRRDTIGGEIMFRGNTHDEGLPQQTLGRPTRPFEADRSIRGTSRSCTRGTATWKDQGFGRKDVIISGGENISSLEVEDAICHLTPSSSLRSALVVQPD